MARTSPTRGWVQQYAEELLLAGSPPTVSVIRQRIFVAHNVTPSTSTVTNELSRFWEQLAVKLRVEATSGVASPQAAGADSLELIELPTFQSSDDKVERLTFAELQEEVTRLQYSNLELSAKSIRLTGELEQQQKLVEEKDNLLGQAVLSSGGAAQQVTVLEEKLSSLIAESEATLRAKERAWTEATNLMQSELEQAKLELEKERQNRVSSQQQLDGARKHLMLETDRIRSQAESATVSLKQELETARIREGQYLQQRNKAFSRIEELERALENSKSSKTAEARVVQETIRPGEEGSASHRTSQESENRTPRPPLATPDVPEE
jgi:hypothetical protein